MDKILSLIEKRRTSWDAAKAFLDAKRGTDGTLSAEDAATYDKMEKEVTDLTRDIERLQRQDEIEKMLNQPTSAPITNIPGKTGDKADEKTGRASAAYKKAFWDNIRHPGNPAIRDVLEAGADGYVTKPYATNNLIDRVRLLLASGRQSAPPGNPPAGFA